MSNHEDRRVVLSNNFEAIRVMSPVVTETTAAAYIGRSSDYLRSARIGRSGTPGPDFVKVGTAVLYEVPALDQWKREYGAKYRRMKKAPATKKGWRSKDSAV